METANTMALLAETDVTVKRETGRGWVIRHGEAEITTHRGRKSDALSLAVVAALEIKDAMEAEADDANSTDNVVIVELADGSELELAVRIDARNSDPENAAWDWAADQGYWVESTWIAGTVAELMRDLKTLDLPRIA